MKHLLFGFGICAVVSLLQVGLAEACQGDRVLKCVEGLNIQPQEKFIYTKEEIQSTCKLFYDYLICLNETGCQTIPEVAVLAGNFRQSADYICKEHYDEYLKHERCLNSENVAKAQKFCAEEAKTENNAPCENKNFLLSCFVRSIGGCCGNAASRIADGLLKVMMQQISLETTTDDCQLQSNLDAPIAPFCSATSTPDVPIPTFNSAASTPSYNIFVVELAFILFISMR